MDNNTLYYVRSRHKGAKFGLSAWGPTSHFRTKINSVDSANIVSPVSGTTNLSSQQQFSIAAFQAGVAAVSIPQISNGEVIGYVSANRSRTLESTEWQLSKVSDFSVIDKTTTTLAGIVDWLVTGLLENTSYYLRVRQVINYIQPVSADGAGVVTYNTTQLTTNWTASSVYATKTQFIPNTPTFSSPTDGVTGLYKSLTLETSAFHSDSGSAHQSSDWEISTDSGFSTVAFSQYNSTTALTSATFSALSAGTTYYARVRYRDALGRVSAYSAPVSFSTLASFAPAQPTITNITNGVSKLGTSWYPVTSSAFSGKGTDTHASSTWQFSTTSTFNAGTITSSVTNSTTDKTTFTPVGLLNDTVYYARVMHRGADGLDSPWSPVVSFSITSNSVSYTTNGTFNYTVPAGVTQATLDGLGGGGGGGGGNPLAGSGKGGGGGASGKSASLTIPVVAGDVISVTIGARAVRGLYGGNNGGTGAAVVFKKNGTTVLTVAGGAGGTISGAGQASGNSVAGVWTGTYKGGNGGGNPNGGAVGAGSTVLNGSGAAGGQGQGGGGAAAYDSASSAATYGGYGGFGKGTITVS